MSPYDASTIEDVVMAIIQRPREAKLLVAGDFNFNLVVPEGHALDEAIAAALSMSGLEYMSAHFLPRRKPWLIYGRTWRIIYREQELRS